MEEPSIANRHFGFLRGRSYKVPPRFRYPQTFFILLQGISWGQFVENTFWKIQLHTNFSSNAKKREREREMGQCYRQRVGIYKDELNRDSRTEKRMKRIEDSLRDLWDNIKRMNI